MNTRNTRNQMSKPALDIKQTLAEYKYDGIIIINITIIITLLL